LLLVFACGGLRYQLAQPRIDPSHVAWYRDRVEAVVVQGVLVEPPDVRDQAQQLKLRLELIYPQAGAAGVPVEGLLLARLAPGGDWRYGDRLRLEGELVTPSESEEFSYRDYLSRQGVYAYMAYPRASLVAHTPGNRFMAAIYALKGRLLQTIYRQFPDPEASLMAGILLGVEAGIPPDVRQAFQDTGTAHIIAISGFNMAIVAGLFAGLFGRLLGRRKGAVAAVIAIALYTVLVGANAAVVRAAIMGGLGVFAAQVGRRQSGLNTLVATAADVALFIPEVLWDAGFLQSLPGRRLASLSCRRRKVHCDILVMLWSGLPG
jgi:competence protein ComEC